MVKILKVFVGEILDQVFEGEILDQVLYEVAKGKYLAAGYYFMSKGIMKIRSIFIEWEFFNVSLCQFINWRLYSFCSERVLGVRPLNSHQTDQSCSDWHVVKRWTKWHHGKQRCRKKGKSDQTRSTRRMKNQKKCGWCRCGVPWGTTWS